MGATVRRHLKLITAPSVEPLTTTEAKDFARIGTTADDTLVDNLVKAARLQVEHYLGRSLVNTVWDLFIDAAPQPADRRSFTSDVYPVYGLPAIVELSRSPVSAVASVNVTNDAGTESAVATTVYYTDLNREPARVILKEDQSWPDHRDHGSSMRIRYTAGYGSAASDIPEAIRVAIRQLVATYYEHREQIIVGTISSKLPTIVEALLAPYVVVGEAL